MRFPTYIGDVVIRQAVAANSVRLTCLSCGSTRVRPSRSAAKSASEHVCVVQRLKDSATEGVMALTWPICLMGVRTKPGKFHGMIAPPGGWLKRGESPVDGAKREWREETGISADCLDVMRVLPYSDESRTTTHVVLMRLNPVLRADVLAAAARTDAGLERWNVWRPGSDPVHRLHPALTGALETHGMMGILKPVSDLRALPLFSHDNVPRATSPVT